MSSVRWALAGWVALSLLVTLAFVLGAGIGYRRGREDSQQSFNIHLDQGEQERQVPPGRHASRTY